MHTSKTDDEAAKSVHHGAYLLFLKAAEEEKKHKTQQSADSAACAGRAHSTGRVRVGREKSLWGRISTTTTTTRTPAGLRTYEIADTENIEEGWCVWHGSVVQYYDGGV